MRAVDYVKLTTSNISRVTKLNKFQILWNSQLAGLILSFHLEIISTLQRWLDVKLNWYTFVKFEVNVR